MNISSLLPLLGNELHQRNAYFQKLCIDRFARGLRLIHSLVDQFVQSGVQTVLDVCRGGGRHRGCCQ